MEELGVLGVTEIIFKVVDKENKIEILKKVDCGDHRYKQKIDIEKSYIPDLIKTLQKIIGEKK